MGSIPRRLSHIYRYVLPTHELPVDMRSRRTGNLSSDKVSKRDVFDLFHRFGRLAQISLKSAYGFVQYHTAEEGHSAIESLQDVEIKGRRVRESCLPTHS